LITKNKLKTNLLSQSLRDFNIQINQVKTQSSNDSNTLILNGSQYLIECYASKEVIEFYHANLMKQKLLLENELKRSESILNNQNFIARASKQKVEEEKQKYQVYQQKYEQLLIILHKK